MPIRQIFAISKFGFDRGDKETLGEDIGDRKALQSIKHYKSHKMISNSW
jgi:hypothetical protein